MNKKEATRKEGRKDPKEETTLAKREERKNVKNGGRKEVRKSRMGGYMQRKRGV